jgi:RNA polymerase sigma factor (sigma-70 family)
MSREELFLAHLPLIERVIAFVIRRRHLRSPDAEDFRSVVMLRLIDSDYRVLAAYQGQAEMKTYLTTVIQRFYLDFQIQRWGKWRASSKAKGLGRLALLIEQLVYRDRLTFEEAYEVLKTDVQVPESRDELYALWQKLPRHSSRLDGPQRIVSPAGNGLSELEKAEQQALAARVEAAVCSALSRLPARDFLILRLHWEDGLSIADIARSLKGDQKAFYRTVEKIVEALRNDLEAQGISGEDVRQLVGRVDWDVFAKARSPNPGRPELDPSKDPGRLSGRKASGGDGAI